MPEKLQIDLILLDNRFFHTLSVIVCRVTALIKEKTKNYIVEKANF